MRQQRDDEGSSHKTDDNNCSADRGRRQSDVLVAILVEQNSEEEGQSIDGDRFVKRVTSADANACRDYSAVDRGQSRTREDRGDQHVRSADIGGPKQQKRPENDEKWDEEAGDSRHPFQDQIGK